MAVEFVAGNRLLLLNSNAEYVPALLHAIAAARCEIFLESYIFADDETGRLVATRLAEAAQRGVVVRVLVDGFGARGFEHDFLPGFLAAGVQAMIYRPEVARFRLRRHRLRRLHRKLVVVDGIKAFVGGINIIDDQNTPAGLGPRFDFAVQVEGPVLAAIHATVRRMWENVAWVNFRRRFRVSVTTLPSCGAVGDQWAAFLIRDNIRHRYDIANAYIEAIEAARQEVIIANAYFLPGMRFRHALVAAARRGVRVSVLLQGSTDHPLLRDAARALYGALIDGGVSVFEYVGGFLHAKVAVIDRLWATVGSSNIDPMSLLVAKEANLVVQDRRFAETLRQPLLQAMAERAVHRLGEDLKKRPWHVRLRCWLSFAVVRALIGLAGYDPAPWRSGIDDSD